MNPSSRSTPLGPAVLAAAVTTAAATATARASERRFTFTYEATTAARGELEYEQWATWSTDKESDPDFDRLDFRHELELGITDQFQVALYLTDWRYQRGRNEINRVEFRDVAAELIYTLSDPRTQPLGVALYEETKIGDQLIELEGKLILQKNLGPWVIAWNGTIEAEWEGSNLEEANGTLEQTLGVSYQFSPALLGGFEFRHEVEYAHWSQWQDHVASIGPNLSYRAPNWWVTVTPLFQVTDARDEPDLQLRLIFGFEF